MSSGKVRAPALRHRMGRLAPPAVAGRHPQALRQFSGRLAAARAAVPVRSTQQPSCSRLFEGEAAAQLSRKRQPRASRVVLTGSGSGRTPGVIHARMHATKHDGGERWGRAGAWRTLQAAVAPSFSRSSRKPSKVVHGNTRRCQPSYSASSRRRSPACASAKTSLYLRMKTGGGAQRGRKVETCNVPLFRMQPARRPLSRDGCWP